MPSLIQSIYFLAELKMWLQVSLINSSRFDWLTMRSLPLSHRGTSSFPKVKFWQTIASNSSSLLYFLAFLRRLLKVYQVYESIELRSSSNGFNSKIVFQTAGANLNGMQLLLRKQWPNKTPRNLNICWCVGVWQSSLIMKQSLSRPWFLIWFIVFFRSGNTPDSSSSTKC